MLIIWDYLISKKIELVSYIDKSEKDVTRRQ